MILFKYVQTRRRLNTWLSLDFGLDSKSLSATTGSTGMRSAGMRSMGFRRRRSRAYSGSQQSATFDNWLVIRLTIAFLALWYDIVPLPRSLAHTSHH